MVEANKEQVVSNIGKSFRHDKNTYPATAEITDRRSTRISELPFSNGLTHTLTSKSITSSFLHKALQHIDLTIFHHHHAERQVTNNLPRCVQQQWLSIRILVLSSSRFFLGQARSWRESPTAKISQDI